MSEFVTEHKLRHDGGPGLPAEQHEVMLRTPGVLVLRGWTFTPRQRPWGVCDSYGVIWQRRPYVCYYIIPHDTAIPAAARFDIVRDVRITADSATYTDLVLDLFVRDCALEWEDEDELAEETAAGKLTPRDLAIVAHGREVLTRHHKRIVREVRAHLEACGVAVR